MKRGVFRIMSRISSAVLESGVSAPGAGIGVPSLRGGRGDGEGTEGAGREVGGGEELRSRDSSKSSGSSSILDIVVG